MIEWFCCLSDIPNLGYTADLQVKRTKLRGHDISPVLSTFTFEGTLREALSWPMPNGSTSQSPAAEHAVKHLQNTTNPSKVLLRRLTESLELPGTVSDYHFAIQRVVEELWTRWREEPSLLREIERLCWLDIRLIEARPETIVSSQAGSLTYFRVLTFGRLIELYSGEGYLREALDVAERGAQLHQSTPVVKLRERLTCMEAEEL